MELTIKERLLMASLYPRESSLTEQVIIRDINKKVELSQEEQSEIKLVKMSNGYNWDEEKATIKMPEFSDAEISVLKAQVDRLDGEKKITTQLVDLCLKIKNL